jgi:hypothetical protein
MVYNTPLNGKIKTRQFGHTMAKLPDAWPYGKKTKGQWLKDFEKRSQNGTNTT